MKVWSLNGDCQVIQTADGRVYVYDTAEPRIGRHTLIPFIANHLKVRYISGLIIGHYHWNHTGGAEYLIRYFSHHGVGIGSVYSSGVYSDDRDIDIPIQNRMDEAIAVTGVQHRHVVYGDKIADDITVISPMSDNVSGLPTDDRGRKVTTNANDETGCSVRFVEGDFSVLLTSDLGPGSNQKGLRDMIAGDLPVSSTVFQIPHHGDISYIDTIDNYDYEIINALDPDLVMLGARTGYDVEADLIPYLNGLNISYVRLSTENRFLIQGHSDGTYIIKTEKDGGVPKMTSFSRGAMI